LLVRTRNKPVTPKETGLWSSSTISAFAPQEAKLNRATIRYFAFDTEWPFEMTILCFFLASFVLFLDRSAVG